LIFQVLGKIVMAKCTKCGADITSTGYDTEELKLPNDATGYMVSCKQCKTVLGIIQEK
jgi:NAD-dependent SIR2 family protein deacetylase